MEESPVNIFCQLWDGVKAGSPSIKLERLPTNTTTSKHPIHRWYNFIAGYSPEFVNSIIGYAGLGFGDSFLDPFSGCGTGPLEASKLGLNSLGYEANPIFERISRAKMETWGSSRVIELISSLIEDGIDNPQDESELPADARIFLNKLVETDHLEALLGAKKAVNRLHGREHDLAFLILSKMLDLCSRAATDGIYKAPTTTKKALMPREALALVVDKVRHDVALDSRGKASYSIFGKSSENMKEVKTNSISVIITSPPYLNNFDYAEMTRMYLYFWGIANSWGEISNTIRNRLIVNTTTALKGQKEKFREHKANLPASIHADLDFLFTSLSLIKREKKGKKEYDHIIFPYFSQMTSVLRECLRVMKNGAGIHIIIADAAFYGIHISTPQILTHIMGEIGFKNLSCDLMRTRGHRWVLDKREGSKTGLGEYHISGEK